jgi:DNA-directed RNA polymerase subunit F
MDTNKPLQFASVLDRIKSYQTKLAADSSSVTDPADKGTVGIPRDPEATHAKQNIPENKDNTVSNEGAKLEDEQLHPVSTGKNVPSAANGNAKENVSSPTESLSKIANRVSAITAKLKAASSCTTDQVPEMDKDLVATKKPKTDTVGGVPDAAANKDEGKTKPPFGTKAMNGSSEKEAANDSLAADISPEALMKLAATILTTEGGLEAVEPVLMKAAGLEAARQIMADATASYTEYVKSANEQATHMEYVKQAAQQEAAELSEFLKSASESDKEQIVKIASIHQEALANIEQTFLKQAYMQGAADAAAMEDSGGEELPGAEGGASLEQIAQLLQAMVESGEIDEETAMAVLQELAGGAQGEMPPGAEGGMPAVEGGSPEEEAAMAAMAEKGASYAGSSDFQKSSALCMNILSRIK